MGRLHTLGEGLEYNGIEELNVGTVSTFKMRNVGTKVYDFFFV